MSVESIIGIVASLITIIGAPFAFYKFINPWIKRMMKYPYVDTLNELVQKDLLDEERRKILRKLNKSPHFNNRISEDYIRNFVLDKRSRENVLFDICDSNNIELTNDICKDCLGSNMPSLVTRYKAKREDKQEEQKLTSVESTIKNEPQQVPNQPSREQSVYMSELLKEKYPKTCDRLIQILKRHNIKYDFIKGTKDIWCRDYMPIQTESGKFIQFKYDPSYLKGKKEDEETRSDVQEVCKVNNINAQFSDINLDGGNVLICDGRAIISDRVYTENPGYNEDALKEELSRLLECEIIIIPAQKSDMTGHADGMVRFVNKDTILGNNLDAEYKYWREGMQKVIEKYGLKYINMPFFEPKDPKHPLSAVGVYVNYLEVNSLIVLPVFRRDEDKQAIDIIKDVFPDRIIETIDYNDVAFEGGLLNCTTWVVRQ